MAKFSRKTKIRVLGARPVLVITGFLSFICLAGLGYLWQVKQLHALGRQIKVAELKLDEMRQRKEGVQRGFAAKCSPRELEEQIRIMKLGLEAPTPNNIVRLADNPPPPVARDDRGILAGATHHPQP